MKRRNPRLILIIALIVVPFGRPAPISAGLCDPPMIAKLAASDAAATDFFGQSVSISGSTAVIGAPLDDDGGIESGSAYVARDVGGVWQQIAKLNAADAAAEDNFGWSVALSGDTAVIGAPLDDDGGMNSGSAYVFRDVGGVWQQIAKLNATDAAADDNFGWSVALSGDTAVIGAILEDDGGAESGAAYVFRDVGGVWQQIAKLTADDAAADDRFGVSASISGETAIIGAVLDDDGGANSGSAYAFRDVGGAWQQIAKLTAADTAANDFFGVSVSISGDTAVIGAALDDDGGDESGSAYVFREIGGVWQQIGKLIALDAAADDNFGFSVSVSDGTVVVGVPLDDIGGIDSGSAYVFREVAGVWQQIAEMTAADAAAGDNFGINVSVNGSVTVIGAYFDDDGGADSGSAYVFDSVTCDTDGDDVPDPFDVCPKSALGLSVDCEGRPLSDCNGDCLVNALDIQCVVDELLNQ